MPEYLAPGVYVEEISSGNKPIQAASTSTAGMVGMTARGPVGRPTLVTSRGAYARLFGGRLDPETFPGGKDALPYAAEGFFVNGGTRLYVVRVVGPGATAASTFLLGHDPHTGAPAALSASAAKDQSSVAVSVESGFAAGGSVLVGGELTTVADPPFEADPLLARPLLGDGLRHSFPAGATLTVQKQTALAGRPAGVLEAGATDFEANDVTGVAAGAVLLLQDASGEAADHEVITVQSIDPATRTITLEHPLRRRHESATLATLADDSPVRTLEAAAGPSSVPVSLDLDDPSGVVEGAVVRLDDGDGTVEHTVVTTVTRLLKLKEALTADHPAGTTVRPVQKVMEVRARWQGSWGNLLRVTAHPSSLLTTQISAAVAANAITLPVDNPRGLHRGSIVEISSVPDDPPADPPTPVVTVTAEVADVDMDARRVHLTAAPGRAFDKGATVTSREFSLVVERLEKDRAVETERFDDLSLVPEHPRYAPSVVGRWAAETGPSASGASELVRLGAAEGSGARLLPLLTGTPRYLAKGDDDATAVDADSFVGKFTSDPDERTGIQALENEPTLSIVGVPGQTSLTVQQALVAHCDKMRYRFAVLDVPRASKLEAARTHRQNFDTTRAALYYPDLLIADPFGAPGDQRAIPPSGHVMGVYARTDGSRGVHKAPANEVLSGALALSTALTKGEQDILNPIHLNCLRDFRSENRGLRVYGARVATSDPEWKYVNVRRLLLFIEQSLETGLQWAVFEPNDKPLWDAVKQSITGFLITVWRSGALEGIKQEEAFFVNIGYDVTMTQADIDNGLLVVEVGVAAVKPAEFVVVRISQKTREAIA